MYVGHFEITAQCGEPSHRFGYTTVLTIKTAAAKGLVVGCFSIHREDGTLVDGLDDKEVRILGKSHHLHSQLSGHACSKD